MLRTFFEENSGLEPVRKHVLEASDVLVHRFMGVGNFLVCGNDGSCPDSDHIVEEPMKGFLLNQTLPPFDGERFASLFGPEEEELAGKLQSPLPAVLTGEGGVPADSPGRRRMIYVVSRIW